MVRPPIQATTSERRGPIDAVSTMRIMRVRVARRRAKRVAATPSPAKRSTASTVENVFDEDLFSPPALPADDGPGDSVDAAAAMGASGCVVRASGAGLAEAAAGLSALAPEVSAVFSTTVGATAPAGAFLSAAAVGATARRLSSGDVTSASLSVTSGGKASAARKDSVWDRLRASAAIGASGEGCSAWSLPDRRAGGSPAALSRQMARTRMPAGVGSTDMGSAHRPSVGISNLV